MHTIIINLATSTLFFLILFQTASPISDSEALLKLRESFNNPGALDSWKPGTHACAQNDQWEGVICGNGIVNGLRLGEMNLSGNIDVDALAQIPGLRSISFKDNSFSGNLPGFNRLIALRGIYLSGNQFSGEIPSDYFVKMESLRKVWLSENKFTGGIPSSLAQLPHLIELHLENNQFSGPIPSFTQISLMDLDLSNNSLSGEIPPGLSRFNASEFQGNVGLCGGKLGTPCNKSAPETGGKVINNTLQNVQSNSGRHVENKTRNADNNSSNVDDSSRNISIGFLIASGIMLAFMFIGIFVLRRRQERDFDWMERENLDENIGGSVSGGIERDISVSQKRTGSSRKGKNAGEDLVLVNYDKGEFGLAHLMKAAAEVLGNGPLGASYKATLYSGLTVVVKRIKDMNGLGKDGFDAEMRRLGRMNHKNVLPPLAYHYRKEEKLLVYEYVPMGSLLYLLHGDRGPSHAQLNWPTRVKIIQGIARGLAYLHTELSSIDLPHGDLKSSNILLRSNYEPVLADYGFNCLLTSNQARLSLLAYKSPEALQSNEVSPKCDVYCLGIIILELITGKFPSQYLSNGNGGTDLVEWVRSAVAERKVSEIFDPEIASSKHYHGEIENVLLIGAACTESNPVHRLDIREAISRIENIQTGGNQDRHFQEMPTLRDGYADSLVSHSQVLGPPDSIHGLSGRRRESLGDR